MARSAWRELRVVQVVAVFIENGLEAVKRGDVGCPVLGAQMIVS